MTQFSLEGLGTQRKAKPGLSAWQIVMLLAITIVYLTFELSFNARLLDAVGALANPEHMEVYGRCLSGIAVALFVFQGLLISRAKKLAKLRDAHDENGPHIDTDNIKPISFRKISFWCLLAAILTYMTLKVVLNVVVAAQDAHYRKVSMSIALLQKGLVNGKVILDGLDKDPDLFQRPDGKAFLALFPVMATAVDHLDDKIRDAKLGLISSRIEQSSGGPQGYYKNYQNAIAQVGEQWSKYRKAGTAETRAQNTESRADDAWSEYLSDLGKHGWTPSTIPFYARNSVVRKVRAKIAVPKNWDPADEQGFRAAVASRVQRQSAGKIASDGSIIYEGKHIPPGLSFSAFLAQPVVQAKMREKLRVPPGTTILPAYANAAEFMSRFYQPMLRFNAEKTLKEQFDASAESFAPGGSNWLCGDNATRAVLAPFLALLFSLIGAISHFSKSCYLIVKLILRLIFPYAPVKIDLASGLEGYSPVRRFVQVGLRKLKRRIFSLDNIPILTLVSVFTLVVMTLGHMQSDVTRSRVYSYLQSQVRQVHPSQAGEQENAWPSRLHIALGNTIHVIAIGQSFGYPVNEYLRTQILHGMNFGFNPDEKHEDNIQCRK